MPGIYLQAFDEVFSLFFSAMEKNHIMLMIDIVKLPLQFLICYLFICVWNLDLLGCALAFNLSFVVKFIALRYLVSILSRNDPAIREGLFIRINHETFEDFYSFMKLSTNGLFLCCLEWWVTEAMAIMSGLISVQAQAASVIINTFSLGSSYITLGFSLSMSAIIGSELGKNNIIGAKTVAK
jgi:Na+-driven multidrug efflux pump